MSKMQSEDSAKTKYQWAAIILAAGQGKRLKSPLPKVLHPIAGVPMVVRTLTNLQKALPSQMILVTIPKVKNEIENFNLLHLIFAYQKKPLGTANATAVGLKKVKSDIQTVAILYGDDTAFYQPQTFRQVFKKHLESQSKVTFVSLYKDDPKGYGRVIRQKGKVVAVIEEKDATKSQKKIKEVNDGLYFFDKEYLDQILPQIKKSKVTGEYYITDVIKIALHQKQKVHPYLLSDKGQWHGINTPQELKEANLKIKKRIHIMGIGGAGAAAVANIAQNNGYEVSGCDLNPDSPYLVNSRLPIIHGHHPSHVENIGLLVVSPAVLIASPKNSEVKKARQLGIEVITWQKFQGEYLEKNKFVICVAGTFGKSTTTAMISKILEDANFDPTCEVGANILSWGKNYRLGNSAYYVAEGDEYNNNFLNYNPDIAIILNMAWDHPDFFASQKQVVNSYRLFVDNIKPNGILVVPDNKQFASFFKSKRKDIKIQNISSYGPYKLKILGDFRRENADAAITTSSLLGIDNQLAKMSIEQFRGLARRLQFKGEIKNCLVFDDYAVQPYTVYKTTNALLAKFPKKRLALVFEPHTFSRIKRFFKQFTDYFQKINAHQILITDVFSARERGDPQQLALDLAKSSGPKAIHTGNLDKTGDYLIKNLSSYDIILTMGAGDIYKIYDMLLTRLKHQKQ